MCQLKPFQSRQEHLNFTMIPAIQISLIHKVFKAVEREGPLGNVLLGLHDVLTVHSLLEKEYVFWELWQFIILPCASRAILMQKCKRHIDVY